MRQLNKNNASWSILSSLRSGLFWKQLTILILCFTSLEIASVMGERPVETSGDDMLEDDVLDSKHPVFDLDLIDSRIQGDWSINSSDAVIKLDTPPVRADLTPELTKLYPSYKVADKAAPDGVKQLVSVNMLDAKGKQFDDGLYAAIDQAYYQEHVALVRRFSTSAIPVRKPQRF